MKHNVISTTRLAKICGVSQGTVDRALNNRDGINPKTKEKILAAAKEYGYRPNIHARSMAGGRSMLIGVVVFDLDNPYFCNIVTKISAECEKHGYSVVVMFTNKDSKKEIECIQNLYHMSVDGIVLCPINEGDEYESYLNSLQMPIVTIGNKLKNIPYVGIDNAVAMREIAEHVISNGYEELIYVKPILSEKNTFAQKERLDAITTFCEDKKIRLKVTNINEAVNIINQNKTTAIICSTDIYAVRLFHLASRLGIGIIGFDNINLIEELDLLFDSVGYDVDEAARVLTEGIICSNPVSTIISHRLIKRGSI